MAVHEKIGMPLDEFIELSNDHPFELINGERIPRLPTVGGHNYIIHVIYQFLLAHLVLHKPGQCFIEATYVLPDHYDSNWVIGSRIPDLLFISQERWATYIEANTDWREKPYLFIPDLVIEVVSPTDKYTKVDEKVDAYLADGVRLILVVDPQRRKAIVYSPDAEQPLHLSGDAKIDFSDVIPDFQMTLSKLFE
ncbi:MAG TPA: Uma2 family endonuclease [Phototrophicaceae bacterium]|nr:Uma2 family endonuclease [Phototrophicaceae bacterium]